MLRCWLAWWCFSYLFCCLMFDVGQMLAQQNTENQPTSSFCTLVKFTSHFIQRKLLLYSNTHTHTHTPLSVFYYSAKKQLLKNTQTRWVGSLKSTRALSQTAKEPGSQSHHRQSPITEENFPCALIWSVKANSLCRRPAFSSLIQKSRKDTTDL